MSINRACGMSRFLASALFLVFFAVVAKAQGDIGPRVSPSAAKSSPAVKVMSLSTSVPGSGSPVKLVLGQSTELRSGIGFAKLLVSFEPAIKARRVSLESCSIDFRDGVEFFAHPGARRVYVEGGTRAVTADFGTRLPEISTLAILLRGNMDGCLKNLRFMSDKGAQVSVEVSDDLLASASSEVKEFDQRYQKFTEAGLTGLLDQEITPESRDDGKWIFRLRGDGTFFVFGRADDFKTGGRFSGIGEYQIQTVAKNRIRLGFNGYRLVASEPWDGGWGCQSGCEDRKPARMVKIEDTIEIEKLSVSSYMIRNRTSPQHRALHFSDIRVTTTAH